VSTSVDPTAEEGGLVSRGRIRHQKSVLVGSLKTPNWGHMYRRGELSNESNCYQRRAKVARARGAGSSIAAFGITEENRIQAIKNRLSQAER